MTSHSSSFSSPTNPFNSRDPENIPSPTAPVHHGVSAPQVHLGSDPGALLASLPTLLGFPPNDSLVAIGLSSKNSTDSGRMRVGPIVRTDIDDPSLSDVVEAIADNICLGGLGGALACHPDQCGEVILLAVDTDQLRAEQVLREAIRGFYQVGIHVALAVHVPYLATGQEWVDVLGDQSGVIGDVERNAIRDIATLNRARTMRTREEMERWLDSREPVAELFAGAAANYQSLLHSRSVPEQADVACMIGLSEALGRVERGQWKAEDLVSDEIALSHLLRASVDAEYHTYVVACSAGHYSSIMRDFIAEAVCVSSGPIRRRLMVLLALVLTVNDEGTLAFHTINRARDELLMAGHPESEPWPSHLDKVSMDMADLIITAHRAGFAKKLIQLILVQALELVTQVKTDVEIFDELLGAGTTGTVGSFPQRDFLAIATRDGETLWPEATSSRHHEATLLPVLSREEIPSCLDYLRSLSWKDIYERLQDAVNNFDWERINCALNASDRPTPG